MPAAEIAATITSVRASLDIAKAMISLRDGEAFRAKSIELQGLLLDVLEKSIAAREAQALQLDRIRALETELADLKAWSGEEERYELVALGRGSTAFMLKPDARSTEPPHWLCPSCFASRKKAYFQPQASTSSFGATYACAAGHKINVNNTERPQWRN